MDYVLGFYEVVYIVPITSIRTEKLIENSAQKQLHPSLSL